MRLKCVCWLFNDKHINLNRINTIAALDLFAHFLLDCSKIGRVKENKVCLPGIEFLFIIIFQIYIELCIQNGCSQAKPSAKYFIEVFLRVLSSNDKPKLQVRMKYVALIQVINEPVQCDKKDRWRHTEGKYWRDFRLNGTRDWDDRFSFFHTSLNFNCAMRRPQNKGIPKKTCN